MVTTELIQNLADEFGGTVVEYGGVNTHIKLPNGATVSIAYGVGAYKTDRFSPVGLPQSLVEVAYSHPAVPSVVTRWDDDDNEYETQGDFGDFLPNNDVHGWQNADELREIVIKASKLEPWFIDGEVADEAPALPSGE